MATIGSYYVRVLPDMSGFNRNLISGLNGSLPQGGESAGRTFGRAFGNSFLGFVGRIAIGTTIGRLVTNGFNTIVNGFSTGIERLDIVENYPRIMSNLGIANEDAERSVERLQEALFGLPTSLQSGVTATQRLTATLGDIDRGTDAFIAFNNAVVAGMAPAELQAAAIEQFSQAVAKGKPDMLEWRSMVNAMPAQMAQVASSFGMTTAELGEALRQGDLSMDEFLDHLILLNEEGTGEFASFAEQAHTATNTIGTALTNVGNRVAAGWASILNVFGQENIANFINSVSEGLLGGFNAVAGALQWLGDELSGSGISDAFSALLDVLGGTGEILSNINFSPITEFVSGAGEQFAGMMERIQGHLDDLAPQLDTMKGLWDNLTETIARLVEAAAPLVVEFFANLVSAAVGLAPIVARLVNGFLMLSDIFITFVTEVGAIVLPFLAELASAVVGLVSVIITTVVAFASNLINIVMTIVSSIVLFFANLPGSLAEIWNNIKKVASDAWEALGVIIKTVVNTIKRNVISTFNNVKKSVSDTWSNIKKSITEPINNAKDAVKNAIDKIKGFFNFKITWPHIPLPHFSVSGSANPLDWLKGQLPSFSVSWYAKGGIIDGATLYGVGERGAELVWPSYEPYLSRYAQAIADNMGGGQATTNNYYIDGNLVAADARLGAALETVAQCVGMRQRMGSVRY